MADEMRINARLDAQTAEDLKLLRKALGTQSVTEVVKYSLHRAAQEFRDKQRAKRQKQIWIESRFIGAGEGPEDLSTRYKAYLEEIMDEKYPSQK